MFNAANLNAYQLLGIAMDADERAIKRAYAGLIKQYRPDTNPAEFAQIRAAYEEVLYRHHEQMQWIDAQQETSLLDKVESAIEPESALEPERVSPPEEPVQDTLERQSQYVAALQRSIAHMIRELEAHAEQASEKVMLSLYLAQTDEVNRLPLDMQMDYEPHLLNWLLTTHFPSLLVFTAANLRYDWPSKEFEIARRHGWEGGERFQALSQLAVTYQAVAKKDNLFVQVEDEALPRKVAVASNFNLREAQNLSQEWCSNTSRAEIPHLKNRISFVPTAIWQIYWGDLFFTLLIAIWAWLIKQENSWWAQVITVFISCGVAVSLASLVRYLKFKTMSLHVIKSMPYSMLWMTLVALFSEILFMPKSFDNIWSFVLVAIGCIPLLLVYRLIVEIEVKLVQGGIVLKAGVRWLGKLNLAIRKKLGLYAKQHDYNSRKDADEVDLGLLKQDALAYLKRKPGQLWALSKAIPWWVWGIVIVNLVRVLSR